MASLPWHLCWCCFPVLSKPKGPFIHWRNSILPSLSICSQTHCAPLNYCLIPGKSELSLNISAALNFYGNSDFLSFRSVSLVTYKKQCNFQKSPSFCTSTCLHLPLKRRKWDGTWSGTGLSASVCVRSVYYLPLFISQPLAMCHSSALPGSNWCGRAIRDGVLHNSFHYHNQEGMNKQHALCL